MLAAVIWEMVGGMPPNGARTGPANDAVLGIATKVLPFSPGCKKTSQSEAENSLGVVPWYATIFEGNAVPPGVLLTKAA